MEQIGLLSFWGALNAVYFLPLLLFNKNRVNTDVVAQGKYLPTIKEFFKIAITFSLTVLAWVFFRAENISHAWSYISEIFSLSLFKSPYYLGIGSAIPTVYLVIFFIIIEWMGREDNYGIEKIGFKWMRQLRLYFYYLIIFSIFYFMGDKQEFIYFQF